MSDGPSSHPTALVVSTYGEIQRAPAAIRRAGEVPVRIAVLAAIVLCGHGVPANLEASAPRGESTSETAATTSDRTDNPPELRWDLQVHELRVAPAAKSVVCSFNVTNVSRHAVYILALHSSCSCLAVKLPPLPAKPRRLAPGATATLEVTLELPAQQGDVEKVVVVESSVGFQTLKVNARRVPSEKG